MAYNNARETTYTSLPVSIPDDFLTSPPSPPSTFNPLNFKANNLPEYVSSSAFLLPNILSPSECTQLLSLAESSVPDPSSSSSSSPSHPSPKPWQPALVSIAPGVEAPMPDYRKSDRIIWDSQIIADRIWERCLSVKGVWEEVQNEGYEDGKWEVSRLNDRLRFLKYSPGEFFKPHVDSPFTYKTPTTKFSTHFTLHLYLNDSISSSPDGSGCEGGATSFLSRDRERRLDVNPKAGTVLMFQHYGLLHEGSVVTKGVKYTMRSDLLFEWVPKEVKKEEEVAQE